MTRSIPHSEARGAILELALERLSRSGPAQVRAQDLCRELRVSNALVNYHFGGRDGLLGEAMVVGYERYVTELEAAADEAGPAAIDRLLAWIDRQVEWTAEHPGLAAALNFPQMAAGMPVALGAESLARLEAAGTRNFANLTNLVAAVHGVAPSDARVGLDSALIGWLTLGLSVWNAGRHLPTQTLEGRQFIEFARQHMRDKVTELVMATATARSPRRSAARGDTAAPRGGTPARRRSSRQGTKAQAPQSESL